MRGFLAPVLRLLFKPKTAMDMRTNQTEPDSVAASLGAAIEEHTRVLKEEATGYERRLKETMSAIDDVFNRLGKQNIHG